MAVTCNNCGFVYNEDRAERCAVCNGMLHAPNPSACLSSPSTADPLETENPGVPASRPAQSVTGFERQPIGRSMDPPMPAVQEAGATQSNISGIEGRITHIERNDERPPRDIYRFLGQLLIGILIFIPFAGLFIITGGLSLAFAVIGFRTLSGLFNPFVWSTALFEFLEIMVLRQIRGTDTIPTYRGMIENAGGSRENAFIFRGPMRAGNLVAGHNVRLFGHPNRGTFVIRGGMDLTSNSEIISGYRNPWRYIFYFLLTLYIILGLGVYLNLPEIAGYFG